MSREEKELAVKEMIQSIYRIAGFASVWDGEINDNVAAVVEKMLAETKTCSRAFVWVPKPPGGRATINWLVMTISRSVFAASKSRLSRHCARTVILKWRSALEIASLGVALSQTRIQA